MSDYRLRISVRNARILRELERVGLTQSQFCRKHGVSQSSLCALIAMRRPPTDASGMWRREVLLLCEELKVQPETLFSERQMQNTLGRSTVERDVAEAELASLQAPGRTQDPAIGLMLTDAFSKIDAGVRDATSPRNHAIWRSYHEGETLEELSAAHDICRGRVAQIVHRGDKIARHIGKMRLGIKKPSDLFEGA